MNELETTLKAVETSVIYVYTDGTEDIFMTQAFCPKANCRAKIVTVFFMPRRIKVVECPACGASVTIELPESYGD